MLQLCPAVQVFGWDANGLIVFNAVTCARNTVTGYGGCFRNAGTGIVNNGTVMHDNEANNGGCICESCMYVMFNYSIFYLSTIMKGCRRQNGGLAAPNRVR